MTSWITCFLSTAAFRWCCSYHYSVNNISRNNIVIRFLSHFLAPMGLYGKYTSSVNIFAVIQMVSGSLMLCLGIALRIFVCSWITDAAFGFWIGPLVFSGGLIGYYSTKRDVYGLIGYYLGFNSLCIMFTSVVIFCHSLAWLHFDMQMHSTSNDTSNILNLNSTPSHNYTIMTANITTFPNSTTKLTITTVLPMTTVASRDLSTSLNRTTIWNNGTTHTKYADSSSCPSLTARLPKVCYTDQSWSEYENGRRGVGLGAAMIFVCAVEILMAVLSSGFSMAAANVEPTDVKRVKAVSQGTYASAISSRNVQPVVETPNVENNREEQAPEDGDTLAAVDTGERPMNIYDSLPGGSGEGSADHAKDITTGEDNKVEERSMNIYDTVQIGNIRTMTMQRTGKSVCDMEMTPIEAYENITATCSNDQDLSCFSMPSYEPPPPASAPYPDSETSSNSSVRSNTV